MSKKQLIALVVACLLAVVTFVVVRATSAGAATSTWEVRVLGCHGGLTLYRYSALSSASQREVNAVRHQIAARGQRSVRLFHVRAVAGQPQQFTLISRSVIACG